MSHFENVGSLLAKTLHTVKLRKTLHTAKLYIILHLQNYGKSKVQLVPSNHFKNEQ